MAQTIRSLTITLTWLNLAPPNLVTSSFYLLGTFWQNFSKISSPGGLLRESIWGYNFGPEKTLLPFWRGVIL